MFCRYLAGFALLLFAVTWKLWTPQTDFPQIPFFHVLVGVPGIVDWIGTAILAICLLGMLISGSPTTLRGWSLIFAVFGTVLVLLDQHRLQPWTYQFLVFAILIATCKTKSALFWMRWIVISIYIFSALSKFDYQFIHTVGSQMLSTLVGFLGMDSSTLPENARHWAVVALPCGELLIGIGLVFEKTRKLAVPLAILLHLTLLLVLGPLGLGHRPGVLVWNLFFVGQILILFGGLPCQDSTAAAPPTQPLAMEFIGSWVAVFVILFPVTQVFGICDHWPAWEVYAPRCSRAEIVGPIHEFTPEPDDAAPRQHHKPWLDVSQWSLSEIGVPVYPEARFQLAVAMAVAEKFDFDREFQVGIQSESNRRTGARKTVTLTGRDQMKMRASQFWLNTKARTIWLDD